jgi:hypothetical protein
MNSSGYGDIDPEAVRRRQVATNIKKAFDLFDREGKGMVDVREMGTIVRHLGICPTEIELRDMITEVEEEGRDTGFIRFERFERMMSRVILENQCTLSSGLPFRGGRGEADVVCDALLRRSPRFRG